MRTGDVVRYSRCVNTNLKRGRSYIEVYVGEADAPATLGELSFVDRLPREAVRACHRPIESGTTPLLVELEEWWRAVEGPEAWRLVR